MGLVNSRSKIIAQVEGFYNVLTDMPTSLGDYGLYYGFNRAMIYAVSLLTDEECDKVVSYMDIKEEDDEDGW